MIVNGYVSGSIPAQVTALIVILKKQQLANAQVPSTHVSTLAQLCEVIGI